MRIINVIKGDMRFQWKYGFYFLYLILIIIYMLIFSFLSGDIKNTVVAICVYSDPAAMGMFFMGALILLEKSQRITSSIAVSPMTVWEYIGGKVLSIGLISVLVGMILISQGHTENYLLCALGIFLGSAVFSLCGILVGARISSLNQYIVYTIPFELVGFVPAILYRIGFEKENPLMLIHPGCSIMQLIDGNKETAPMAFLSALLWIGILSVFVLRSVQKMFRQSDSAKL